MSVSRRFAVLAAAGIPLILLAALLSGLVPAVIFWLYNIILLGLLAVDIILSTPASALVVRRMDSDMKEAGDSLKIFHNAENCIIFTVYNPGGYPVTVQAVDTAVPRYFEISGEDLIHTIKPYSEEVFSYNVTPSKRGAFTFKFIHLKVFGHLGFGIKYHRHDCPVEFKVYPNLKDLSSFRIMVQNNRLLPPGEKALHLFGTGSEFKSLRTYVEGDDYRKINWPVTARERRIIVNEYQVEKNQPIFMLIDGGRPMSYSVKGYKKLDYAINASLVLSDIINSRGDQSGLLVFDREVRKMIMPGKGQAHRNNLMESLYHIQETRDTSNYELAINTLCEKQKRRSLVFIFTDFETLEEGQELTSHIGRLKRRHFPILVFMKNEGLIKLSEDEDTYVQDVANAFIAERTELYRQLNALSVANVETEAEKFSVTAVNQYLALRN